MSDMKFELKPVNTKPTRRYRKGSKYDPVLDTFVEGEHAIIEVSISGKNANYLRIQLNKRIEARMLGSSVKVSVVNNVAYLEKV